MTAVNLVPGALPQAAGDGDMRRDDDRQGDAPSLADALGTLLEDALAGRFGATAHGGQWLILRIEEALCGFDDIQQMAVDDAPFTYPGAAARSVEFATTADRRSARRVRPALGGSSAPSST